MNGGNGTAFLRTLRTLGFPDCDKYKPSDFDGVFAEPVLQQFLNYTCTFNEDNVLTKEELNEYESIPPEELIELQNLLDTEETSFLNEKVEDEKEEEEFLQDLFSRNEKRYKVLLEQKELLTQHKSRVLKEKEECQNIVLNVKRIHNNYMLHRIPQAETELFETLHSVSDVITEIRSWIDKSNGEKAGANILKLEDYFEGEEKIINFVESFMQNNFQLKNKDTLELNLDGITNENLLKEVSVLETVLKNSKFSEIQAVCEYKKRKAIEKFFKDCDEGLNSQMKEASSSLLSLKLDEQWQENKRLKQKEKQLISYVSSAISDNVKTHCNEVVIAHANDVLTAYMYYMKAIELPLHHILDQRSRLELLISYISSYQGKLKSMKFFTQEIADFLHVEKSSLFKRKEILKELCEKVPVKENYLPESSIFLSCYKILSAQNKDDVTLLDVIEEIEKLCKKKEILSDHEKERKDVIQSLENQYSEMFKYVSKGKECSQFLTAEKSFSTQVNQLDLLAAEMHRIFTEFQNTWAHNNKLLQTKRNLQLGRSLYILALLDEKKFEETIEKIRKASENSTSSV